MRTFDVTAAFAINKFVMLVCMPALCIEFLAVAPIKHFDFLLLFGYFLSDSNLPFFVTIKAIITNPPLIGILVGLVISLNNLELPSGFLFFLEKMGGTATPALLFSLGIMLSYQDKIAPTKLIVSMTTIKLILHPILAWLLIAFLFGGSYPANHSTALMVAAAPSGVMAYMLAMNYNVTVDRISPIILYTSIGSLITVSLAATM